MGMPTTWGIQARDDRGWDPGGGKAGRAGEGSKESCQDVTGKGFLVLSLWWPALCWAQSRLWERQWDDSVEVRTH